MPHGETSSSATRIAGQLRPQQKLNATKRSLATVALLIAGLEATGHPAGVRMGRQAGGFTARAASRATRMHMPVMRASSDKFQPDDAGDDQPHRRQTCRGRRFAEQVYAER